MNLSIKQKQTHKLVVARDGEKGERWTGNWGLVDANYSL